MPPTKMKGRRKQGANPGSNVDLAARKREQAAAERTRAANLAAGDTDLVAVLRHRDHAGGNIDTVHKLSLPMVQRTYRSVFSGHVRIRSAPTTVEDNQTGHTETGEDILVREVRTDGIITWLRLEPEGGVERWSMLKYRSSTRAFYDLVPLQG